VGAEQVQQAEQGGEQHPAGRRLGGGHQQHGSTVVVVGSTVVVVGSAVVVVVATELTGPTGSVVVGATGRVGGPGVAGGAVVRVGRGVVSRGGAAVVGAWAASATGDTPGGGSWAAVVLVDDDELALEGATAGESAGKAGLVVSAGRSWTAEGTGGWEGTRAAEATRAASTAKVSPKATSMSRQGSRCSAR
jgi:hypothetical protein